ncbi:sigma-70 family RNA polymerase sigma factor [Planctomycetes bacterium K23_9]|uniref:RNA polymerase sigma factor n=1 Tax=Stieleria marina TaxID=1930275 RepID=A0A517P364_9BACT|nr:RNA polymerase sigma factor [Planctomycetes bacterium K23_9]
MEPAEHDDPESSLRESWSIGPLRSWLVQIARRELPQDLQGKLDPSDIAQQTMLDAWRGEQGFQGTTHVQRLAWLRVILRRVVLQHHRKAMAVKRGEGAERAVTDVIGQASVRIEELATGDEPQPDEGVANSERSLLLASAIEGLPEDYRRVIEMRHFQSMTHEEIAKNLGRSNAATRVLWVRALAALRKQCDQSLF